MIRVALEGISKFYPPSPADRKKANQPIAAVKNLNLEVHPGELLVLVGPSGCGKTTTLRIIAGLDPPDEGSVWLGECRVNDVAPRNRDVAMVFQGFALYPHMTIFQNLAFGAEMRQAGSFLGRGWRKVCSFSPKRCDERRDIETRVRQTARRLGVEPLLNRYPGQLSGGERQRVAVGRAIVRDAKLLLFDEPFSNLDARLRTELRRELKELHQQLRPTMIYVTHDQIEALSLGDRVAVMDRGQVHQVGSPDEIYYQPRNRFVAEFFGSVAMNFLEGNFFPSPMGIQFQCPGVAVLLDESRPSDCESPVANSRSLQNRWARLEKFTHPPHSAVVLGVRPEDVLLRKPGEGGPGVSAAARARVTRLEPLGDSSLVHLQILPREVRSTEASLLPKTEFPLTLISKVEARSGLRCGDVQDVVFRTAGLHWFDAQTGENLAVSSPPPVCTA